MSKYLSSCVAKWIAFLIRASIYGRHHIFWTLWLCPISTLSGSNLLPEPGLFSQNTGKPFKVATLVTRRLSQAAQDSFSLPNPLRLHSCVHVNYQKKTQVGILESSTRKVLWLWEAVLCWGHQDDNVTWEAIWMSCSVIWDLGEDLEAESDVSDILWD